MWSKIVGNNPSLFPRQGSIVMLSRRQSLSVTPWWRGSAPLTIDIQFWLLDVGRTHRVFIDTAPCSIR